MYYCLNLKRVKKLAKSAFKKLKSPMFRAAVYFCGGFAAFAASRLTSGQLKTCFDVIYCFLFAAGALALIRFSGKFILRWVKTNFITTLKKIARIISKVIKSLAYPGDAIYLKGGEDQKSFIVNIDDLSPFRKLRRRAKRKRWKDLATNSERVRYIYLRYILKAVRRGCGFNETDTPNEVYKSLSAENPEAPLGLFTAYNPARYNPDKNVITDGDVEDLLKAVKKY